MILKGVKRIFLLGDLHLGVRNNSIEWSQIQYDYLVNHFLKKIDEEGFNPETDILLQLGDWHHVRESTNIRILDVSLKIASKFNKKFKRGVYVILGNHDVYYKDRIDVHSLLGFSDIFENFEVITKPSALTINQHRILLLPWVESLASLKEVFNQYRGLCDYVFCHADIKGVSLTKHVALSHGLEADDFTGYKKVYSGHIHIRQESRDFIYAGTPYEMDRGDIGNVKGFYVLDVSGENISHKFVENAVSPKYLRLEMTDLLNMQLPQIEKLFNNNFIDIAIESSLSKKVQFSTFTDKIKSFGHRSLEFYPYTINQTIKKSEIEIGENYEFNIFSILENYLDQLSLGDTKRDFTYQYFKSLYDKINNQQKFK